MKALAFLLVLSCSVALAGGAAPDTPSPAALQPPAAIQTPAGQTSAPQILETWEGTYLCRQGLTGARLHVTEWNGQTFKIVGEMFPVNGNPSVPRGKAELWGTLDGPRLNLTGYRWIEQPAGYMIPGQLGATAQFSADYRSVNLRLDGNDAGCMTAESNA